MSNLEIFKDSDGVEITEGCRLVWGSISADVQNTGIVRVGDSALDIGNFSLVVHVSFFTLADSSSKCDSIKISHDLTWSKPA